MDGLAGLWGHRALSRCPCTPPWYLESPGLVIIIKRIDVRLSLEVLAPGFCEEDARLLGVEDVPPILQLIMAADATLHGLPIMPTATVPSFLVVFSLRLNPFHFSLFFRFILFFFFLLNLAVGMRLFLWLYLQFLA